MKYFLSKPKNVVVILVIVSILSALIISLFQSANTNNPVYIDEPSVSSSAPEKTAEDYNLTAYVDDENNLAVYVPNSWTKTIQNGSTAFVNAPDGSTIFIDVYGYDPTVSNMTAESLQAAVPNATLSDFQKLTNTSLYYVYENSGITYLTVSEWSFDTTVSITAAIQTSVVSNYADMLDYIFNNIVWQPASPVPDNYMLYYNSFGNFEFGVPTDWAYTVENGVLYLTDETTSSIIGVSVTETAATFDGVSQITFTNVMGQGKSGFMMRSFTNTGTIIQAEATYTNNGQQYVMVEKILCNGSYQYSFAFTCPETSYAAAGSVFQTVTNMFRVLG